MPRNRNLSCNKTPIKRALLKVSGEMLAGDQGTGIDNAVLERIALEISQVAHLGVELGIVLGGGNIFRGLAAASQGMERSIADHMGMLATVINVLALRGALERQGLETRIQSALAIDQVVDRFHRRRAVEYLDAGRIVLFAAGTGNPYFTTDTAAALRAAETGADAIFKGTKVEGVFDRDPEKDADAVFLPSLSYMDAIRKRLAVMDTTAISLCMENEIPLVVFDFTVSGNLLKAVTGQDVGTYVSLNGGANRFHQSRRSHAGVPGNP